MKLKNAEIEVEVLPALGMTIVRLGARSGPSVLWERGGPRPRPRPPGDPGPPGDASLETLHEALVGGWFEISPHAGLPGMIDGHETLLHGEAPRMPWRVLRAAASLVEAELETTTEPLTLRRRIELRGSAVAVSSRVRNRGRLPVSTTHGEHPCFARSVFAGASLSLEAEAARVLPPFDPGNASLVPGEFQWPLAPRRDGGVTDLSTVPPVADHSHDHISIRLAGPRLVLRAPSGPRVTLDVDTDRHPHLLIWRNFAAPSQPGRGDWDVFALEPMSAPGATIEDAVRAGATTRLAPGGRAEYEFAVSLDPD